MKDRDIKVLLQPPNSSNQLNGRNLAAKVFETVTKTNITLLVILYIRKRFKN